MWGLPWKKSFSDSRTVRHRPLGCRTDLFSHLTFLAPKTPLIYHPTHSSRIILSLQAASRPDKVIWHAPLIGGALGEGTVLEQKEASYYAVDSIDERNRHIGEHLEA